MRAFLLSAFLLAASGSAEAAGGPETLFAERTALLAIDRACGLFDPALRQALEAAAGQARGALLRSGWTEARAADLARRAAAEGAARACDDPLVSRAASGAKAGFAGWARLPSMRFPGGEREWLARRTPDPDALYLRQNGPEGAALGLTAAGLVFLDISDRAAASARLYMRDTARAPRSMADVPGRAAEGLAGRTAPRASAVGVWASRRREVAGRTAFEFPPDALARLVRLDPREAIELELDLPDGRKTLLFEVGDVAAALAFLGLHPPR